MANAKKISILWEEKKITILEVDKNQPIQSVVIDSNAIFSDAAFNSGLTEEIQTVALIQKSLRELRIESAEVSLVLSNKDVILRSFVIPALKSNEIQTAVQFEAKKYIPFEINELRYTYHTTPFTVDKTKRLRVVLYAVRKETYDKYERIINQTGLTLLSCEPAVVGLCRAMLYQKDIALDSRVVVLDINDQNGALYFIDQGIAVFIREFQVAVNSVNNVDPVEQSELIKSHVYNEIRNSFDFFNRHLSEQIHQLLVVADNTMFEMVSSFSSDLGVSIRKYAATIASSNQKSFVGIDLLSSFGVLIPPVSGGAPVSDLFLDKQKIAKDKSFSPSININIDIKDFASTVKFIIPAIVLCGGLYGYFYMKHQELNKQVEALSNQQGEFAQTSTDELKAKITKFSTDEAEIRKIRLKTRLNEVTVLITQYVSESMWLDELDLKYAAEDGDSIIVDFKGAVYLTDLNQQVRAINDFISKLRLDKELQKHFKKIQLQSVLRQEINGVTSTTFSVHCF